MFAVGPSTPPDGTTAVRPSTMRIPDHNAYHSPAHVVGDFSPTDGRGGSFPEAGPQQVGAGMMPVNFDTGVDRRGLAYAGRHGPSPHNSVYVSPAG